MGSLVKALYSVIDIVKAVDELVSNCEEFCDEIFEEWMEKA